MAKKFWSWFIPLIIVVVVLAIVIPLSLKEKAEEKEVIKIGWLGPLTGDVAKLGQASLDATKMAIEEANEEGGINGKKIQLFAEDGECNGKAAVSAVNKLVNTDKVKIIIGGACSGETVAVTSITEQLKVLLLSYCSSAPKVTELGDYVFRNYPSDSFQGKFGADFMYGVLRKRNVGIIYDNSEWGVGIAQQFKKRFEELGGSVAVYESFVKGDNDIRLQLTKAKNAKVDSLYTPAYSENQALILKQAKELGMDVVILGADGSYDPNLLEIAGDVANGFMVTIPKADAPKDWQSRYEQKYGHGITLCSVQAYDAGKIIVNALKECGEDTDCIKNYLYTMETYQGISGPIKFDSNGDLENALYRVVVVKNVSYFDYDTGEPLTS